MIEEKLLDEILAEFGDGFQWSDIFVVLPKILAYAEGLLELDGAGKKQKVLDLCEVVLERTDGPGPDWLVDKGVMWLLPGIIDLIIDAVNGHVDLDDPDSL